MSRTRKGSKPIGYDFWSRRPGGSCLGFGPEAKNITHRKERMIDKKLEFDAPLTPDYDPQEDGACANPDCAECFPREGT